MTKKQNNLEKKVQESKIIWTSETIWIPKLELTSLEKTAIHVPTQERYDGLMQVYEIGGIKFRSGELPTDQNYFKTCGKETCVNENNGLSASYECIYRDVKLIIITDEEFYKIQEIPEEDLIKLNKYFERTKPNRASKG